MRQFVRFCLVGALATALDACLFYLLRCWLHYQVSMMISYFVSLCLNTMLTLSWTFSASVSLRNIIRVVGAHLFNLFVVRFGLMAFFVGTVGLADRLAFIPTLGISIVLNFFIIKSFIHKSKEQNNG